jgi:hypothetical protein
MLGRKLVIEEKKKEALHSFLGKLSEEEEDDDDRSYKNTTITMLPTRQNIIVGGNKMSFQMSEEWLADPLVPRKKAPKPKINEPPMALYTSNRKTPDLRERSKSRERSQERSRDTSMVEKQLEQILDLPPLQFQIFLQQVFFFQANLA